MPANDLEESTVDLNVLATKTFLNTMTACFILNFRIFFRGVAYLHAQTPSLIHRDLKSPNLLLVNEVGGPCYKDTVPKNSEQIFPEKELLGLSSQFPHSCVCEQFVYPRIGLSILLEEYMWTDPGNI